VKKNVWVVTTAAVVIPWLALVAFMATVKDEPGAVEPFTMARLDDTMRVALGESTLKLTWVQTPSEKGGVVEIDPDGVTALYQPPDGFVGFDTFRYKVSDAGVSAETTVTVEVIPPLVANAGPDKRQPLAWNWAKRMRATNVVLDGSASSAVDAAIRWEYVSGPVYADPADSLRTVVTLTKRGLYTFRLIVFDPEESVTDTVAITVY
jgi:hypothetical protein